MKKIVVPEGMIAAYKQGIYAALDVKGYTQDDVDRAGVHAVCRWLTSTLLTPSDELLHEFYSMEIEAGVSFEFMRRYTAFFQRHMFDGPEQSIVEQIERREKDYGEWLWDNLTRASQGQPPLPRLDWDKSGRKIPTYADIHARIQKSQEGK